MAVLALTADMLSAALESTATQENTVGNRDWQNTTPSMTVQRPRPVCRVVVTVEVELSKEMMDAARSEHMYDSTAVLRRLFEETNATQMATVAETLDEMRHDGDLVILSSKVEALK